MNKSVLLLEPYSLICNYEAKEPTWIWHKRFALGSCSILSGKPKIGKSTFVRHLIKSVIHGEPFLGASTKKSSVIYLAFEEQKGFVKKIFSEVGLESTEALQLHIGSIDISNTEKLVEELKEACEMFKPELIVIDPLIKAIKIRDTNDYGESTRATQIFLDIARNCNAHVLLIHHCRKGENAGQDSTLGSIGFAGGVDNVMTLDSTSKHLQLAIKGRYIDEEQIAFIRKNGELRLISSENRLDLIVTEIENVLKASELSREQIKSRLGCRDSDVSSALKVALEKGSIISHGEGHRGSKRTYKLNSPLGNESGSELGVEL